MDTEKAVNLSSRGFSLSEVPISPTTHRGLLRVLKKTYKTTAELEAALLHTGLSVDPDHYSAKTKDEDLGNDASAVVFASMLALPELRIDANRRRMMRIVSGLGAVWDEKSGIRLVLQNIADKNVAAVSEYTWAAGPRVDQVLSWIELSRQAGARHGLTGRVSVGGRVTRTGDAADIKRIELSRPVVVKKTPSISLPLWGAKSRDLLFLFWTKDYLDVPRNNVRKMVLNVLGRQKTLAWAESQSRLLLDKIKKDRAWPEGVVGKDKEKEKWRRLLDTIDGAVGSWIKLKRKEKEEREIDEEAMRAEKELKEKEETTVDLYKTLAAICLEYKDSGTGDYIAEETLLALGMKPRLLAMIKRKYTAKES